MAGFALLLFAICWNKHSSKSEHYRHASWLGLRVMASHELPPVAWTYWDQGREALPEVVRICVGSWSTRGGLTDVRVLDRRTVFDYLTSGDLPRRFEELPPQMKSDAVRLALLAKFGGVWMDASTFVSGPLMSWLLPKMQPQGIFLFQNGPTGNGGRLFEIGFIASEPHHPFLVAWSGAVNVFFSRRRLHNAHSPKSNAPWAAKKLFGALNKWLRKSPHRSSFWLRPPLSWLPFYPYFINYYLANFVLSQPPFRATLEAMPFVSSAEYLAMRSKVNDGRLLNHLQERSDSSCVIHDLEFRYPYSDAELDGLRHIARGPASSDTSVET